MDQFNQSLAHTLLELSSLYDKDPETYTIVVKYISSLRVEQVSLTNLCKINYFLMELQWNANPSQTAEEQLIISHFAEAHRLSQVRWPTLYSFERCMGLSHYLFLGDPQEDEGNGDSVHG